MPMRVGFTQFRKQMLERELQTIIETLPSLGVEKVILTGDAATGDYRPDSRIELVVVHKTEYSFGRRADFFSYHLGSSVEIDTQVYTPDEFETLKDTLPALRRACAEGREIFNA
jgi:predicted nucleotidyltransferase